MKKLVIVLTFILFLLNMGYAQELNIQFSITSNRLEGTEKEVFANLEKNIRAFFNERTWTNYKFEQNERIEASISMNVKSYDPSSGLFIIDAMNVVLRRPVFKSAYNSTLLNFVDNNVEFNYIDGESLDYNDATFISNLTSILAFYAYMFIGMDFDTMTPNGGEPFFRQANTVLSNVPANTAKGWSAFDGNKNRYWLLENLTGSAFADIHTFLYTYHRQGLDVMSESVEKGRQKVTASLASLKSLKEKKPGAYILQLMLEAKRDEMIGIYKDGPDVEKSGAIKILKELDPINTSKYENSIMNR